jgi:REP element-mobilizing transposase RayT
VTYLITFASYGAHLHGDESGSVDRTHNVPGSRMIDPNSNRAFAERRSMLQLPYTMDQARREIVLASLAERAAMRGWNLIAAHVRTNHVHVVIAAEDPPERVMNDLKSYASRCLNQAGLETSDRKRWARHGSTRCLYERANVDAAVRYVIEKQGQPMSIYVAGMRH